MAEQRITIGGRNYQVACQPGEEHYLDAAAAMLDAEAGVLAEQIGRMPEARLLLMAGLMLADKTAGIEEQLRAAEARVAALEQAMEGQDIAGSERVEVPVIPNALIESLSEMAARAEALADETEARAQSA
ncbi:cell division protein ZapA [Palleronia rufa]|uniref:cell division protein ZapA n=1 Tax=Palleronia rufa TaxID=1530186 RepID=UPI00056B2F43|nr:cell division protein ZapA [Palleronia rufa]